MKTKKNNSPQKNGAPKVISPPEDTFNLSEKIIKADNKKKDNGFIFEKDVKEAVRRLKGEIEKCVNVKEIFLKNYPENYFYLGRTQGLRDVEDKIDKIFGDELK